MIFITHRKIIDCELHLVFYGLTVLHRSRNGHWQQGWYPNSQTKYIFTSESLGKQSTGDVCHQVSNIKRWQDHALFFLGPVVFHTGLLSIRLKGNRILFLYWSRNMLSDWYQPLDLEHSSRLFRYHPNPAESNTYRTMVGCRLLDVAHAPFLWSPLKAPTVPIGQPIWQRTSWSLTHSAAEFQNLWCAVII